ncbi:MULTISPECIES: amidase [unclassified Bradyrhizobium]|uniref:amidase n=1 Tax=unclassified Bradyrhizobium TaxID=2631580 RepID=UPI00339B9420
MMDPAEYVMFDGLGLADLLHSQQISPLELMDCALRLSEERNPGLNALCYIDPEMARRTAAQAELKGRFGALPLLLKDSGLPSTSLPTSMGSRLFAGSTPSAVDATIVTRFLADGFLPFGRTTVPEFNMAPTTEAVQNGGPTRNPWDRTRSSGGSSGGAAVAVATGMTPIAHGSDGGGSIRIPASCCGIYGLKPSRGLVPAGPIRGEAWGGLGINGVLTRTVRDAAAVLDGIAGMEPGAPYAAPPVPVSYFALLENNFERPLRIAKWTAAFEDIAIAPECIAALDVTETLLTRLGHEVVDAPLPPIEFSQFVKAQIQVLAATVTTTVNGKIRHSSDTGWRERLEPALLDAYELGARLTAEAYALAIDQFHTVGRQMALYMADYDLVLTPTLTQLPTQLGVITTEDDFRSFRQKISRYTAFTAIINASGQPAASLPLHWAEQGLPVGVQLISRFGGEAELLRISAHLESASPWMAKIASKQHSFRPAVPGANT